MADISFIIKQGNLVVTQEDQAVELDGFVLRVRQGPPGPQGPAGVGVPSGGLTGQVPVKASDDDYDIEWADQSGGGASVEWDNVENKPSEFPPSTHTHPISQVIDLQTELNNRATDAELAAEAAARLAADAAIQADVNTKADATDLQNEISNREDAVTAEENARIAADTAEATARETAVNGLDSRVDAIESDYTTSGELSAGLATKRDDGPIPLSDIDQSGATDGQVAVWDDGLGKWVPADQSGGGGSTAWVDITGKPSEFPPSAHTHEIADVDGLQDDLDTINVDLDVIDGKADAAQAGATQGIADAATAQGAADAAQVDATQAIADAAAAQADADTAQAAAVAAQAAAVAAQADADQALLDATAAQADADAAQTDATQGIADAAAAQADAAAAQAAADAAQADATQALTNAATAQAAAFAAQADVDALDIRVDDLEAITQTDQLKITIVGEDEGAEVIADGQINDLWVAPYDLTITKWEVVSTDGTSGSITFDLWSGQSADLPLDAADSIIGAGTKPNLSSVVFNDGVPTGWTSVSLTEGDYVRINVTGASDVKKVVCFITYEKDNS